MIDFRPTIPRGALSTIVRAFRANAILLVPTLFLTLASFSVQAFTKESGFLADLFYPTTFLALSALLWPPVIALLVQRLHTRDAAGRYIEGGAGWREAWQVIRVRYLTPAAALRALTAGLGLTLLINAYGSWKRIIPLINPYGWDELLARLDRGLHFGVDPWRLLHPILARPELTAALDVVYATWHPVLAMMLAWQAWSVRSDLRKRFLLGLVFVWVGLGVVMATVFSSAGPCYYGFLVPGPDPFAPLLEYLRDVGDAPLFAIQGHDMLWAAYETGLANPYIGISAMPSLHVAMPALYTALCWERWRPLGVAFAFYTLLTLVGSVHLGWHYAIDGYLSIAAVAGYWLLSGRLYRPVEAGNGTGPAQ